MIADLVDSLSLVTAVLGGIVQMFVVTVEDFALSLP